MLRSPLHRRRAPLLATLALGLLAGPASAATVTSGKLDWSSTKVYDTRAPADTDRTWLGYVTSPGFLANGTATPSDGATGDTVTTATPSGTVATWSFPATSGDYDAADGTGTITFDGVVSFVSPAPPTGHGFTYAIADPRIVLDGDSGRLFANGISNGPAFTDARVFDLDLSDATVTLHANGSRTIGGIVPSLATAEVAFPGNYAVGAGPERTPNTFGSFAVRLKTAAIPGAKGDKGDRGDRGEAGPRGAVLRVQTSVLRKAPFPGGKRKRITLRRGGRVVAKGSVRARTIRVRLAKSQTKRLRGVYRLRAGKRAMRVRVL